MSLKHRRTAAVVISVMAVLNAAAGTCLVSDPLGHSDDTPIAGTYTTATSGAASSLDSRAWTSVLADGWALFKKGLMIIFR